MNTLLAPRISHFLALHRLTAFTFLALPGAWLVGTCGSLIVAAAAGNAHASMCALLAVLLMAGAALLMLGTRTTAEPLFLLVFVPMPMLISLGFHLGYLGRDAGFFIAVLGMMWPMIVYRPVSRYYKRKAYRVPSGDCGHDNSVPRALSPHPGPLPKGEGEAFGSRRAIQRPINSNDGREDLPLLGERAGVRGTAALGIASNDTTTFNFRSSIFNHQTTL